MGIWGGKCPRCWDDPCHCSDHAVASPPTVVEIMQASKRKCKHQRDNWKARALVYRCALEAIKKLGYGEGQARGFACAVEAELALDDAARIGKGAGG